MKYKILLITSILTLVLLLVLVNRDNSNVSSVTKSSLIPEGIDSRQLEFNNVTLIDSTTFDEATNTCTGTRYGMSIKIQPCVTQALFDETRVQYVNFSWNGTIARNISWIFVYDGALKSGNINALINSSYEEYISNYSNQFIVNYQVNGIKNYTSLGSPNNKCVVGNMNNTQMYFVNLLNGSSNYYCFTDATVVNSTSIRISGNADIGNVYSITKYKPQWVDVTNNLQYLGSGLLQDNRSYYKVSDVEFNVGESIYTQWNYIPKDNAQKGKWHILGYDSSVGLINSVSTNQYIYIDPWWNAAWSRKKPINITANTNTGTRNYTVAINITYDSDMKTDFGDIRFVNSTDNGTLSYWFYNNTVFNSNSVTAYVYIDSLVNQTIYMYYGNPSATTTSNISTSFVVGDDFDGSSLDTNRWSTAGTSTITVSGGLINITGVSGNNYIQSKTFLTHNLTNTFEYAVFEKRRTDSAADYQWWGAATSGFTQFTFIGAEGGSPAGKLYDTYDGAYTTNIRVSDLTQWHYLNKQINNSAIVDYDNGTKVSTLTTHVPQTQALGMLIGQSGNVNAHIVDWIYMRPLANIEPSITFGSEEGGSNVIFLNPLSNTGSLVDSGTGRFNITIKNTNGTAFLEINGINITATNYTDNFTAASVFTIGGTYSYKWISFDNTTNHNMSISDTFNYVVNSTLIINWSSPTLANNSNITINSYFVNLTGSNALSTCNITISNFSSVYPDIDSSNMVLRYDFSAGTGEVLEDKTGNGHNGSIVGATWVTDSGRHGLRFDGVNDAVQINNSAHFDGNQMTIVAWVNVSRSTASIQQSVLDRGHFGATGNGYMLELIYDGVNMNWANGVSVSYKDNNGSLFNSSQVYMGTGRTVMLATNYNYTSGEVKLFLDATELPHLYSAAPAVNVSGISINNEKNITLGRRIDAADFWLNGTIYEIRMYNKTLSPSEVNQIYQYYAYSQSNPVTYPMTVNGISATYNMTNLMNATSYIYQANCTGTNNANNITEYRQVNVIYAPIPVSNLTLTPSSPITYGTASNFSCKNNILNATLFINGVNSSEQNSLSLVRKAGTYNLNCSAVSSGTPYEDIKTYIINKATPVGVINITPSNNTFYSVQTNTTGYEYNSGDGDINYTLFRNGVEVSNPDTQTLAIGIYNYEFNSTSGENYTDVTIDTDRLNVSAIIYTLFNTTVCFQEYSNVSTVCGGLSTGVYSSSGTADTGLPFYYSYDGDWSTYSQPKSNKNMLIITNYSIPPTSINQTVWEVKTNSGISNYSIPDVCKLTNVISTYFYAVNGPDIGGVDYGYLGCYNTSGGVSYFAENISNMIQLYEEAMIWNISYSNINSVTYNANTQPTANENYILNLTHDLILSNAYLVYNGTPYLATITSGGTYNYIISNNLTMTTYPNYPANVSFYWNLIFTNTVLNTSNYYQVVRNTSVASITSSPCGPGLNTSMFFDFADEQNLTAKVATSFNYIISYGLSGNTTGFNLYGNLSNVNNVSICINNSEQYYSVGYGEIQYTLTGSTPRRYYIFTNTRLTNSTIDVTLYGLDTGVTTTFQETVTDNDLNIYAGVYTMLFRWYPSLNEYIGVEMSKTDDKGQSVFNVQTQTVDYRIGVYSPDGTLYQLLNASRFVCASNPCTYSVFVTANAPDYTSFYGVQQSMTYNNNTHLVVYTWNDPSQATHYMNLTVERIDTNPAQLICSSISTGWTGTMVCDTTGQRGTIRANAYRSASPQSFIYSIMFETERGLSAIAGGKSIGLFMMFIFAALGALIGVFSPIAALALGILSLVPMMMLGVINLSVVIGFAILGGIIFHFIRKS